MLPDPADFDGFVSGMVEPSDRLSFLRGFGERLAVLTDRYNRAKALACLELSEGDRTGAAKVADALGVTKARAYQLIADGRAWRSYDRLGVPTIARVGEAAARLEAADA
jgi:hypothetical protein